jgi:hypothetical protein
MLLGLGLFKAGALQARASRAFIAVIAVGLLCLALQAAITAREVASGFAFPDILLAEAVWALTAPAVTLAYAAGSCSRPEAAARSPARWLLSAAWPSPTT